MMYDTRTAKQHRFNRYLWLALNVITLLASVLLAYVILTEGF